MWSQRVAYNWATFTFTFKRGREAKYTTASLVCFYLWSQKAHLYYENPRYPYVCLCMQTKILKTTSETEKSSYLKEIRFAIFYIVIFWNQHVLLFPAKRKKKLNKNITKSSISPLLRKCVKIFWSILGFTLAHTWHMSDNVVQSFCHLFFPK